jgi:hypothetical protein
MSAACNCPNVAPGEGFEFVYALSDPRNPNVPKYVGKTKTSLRFRLSGHLLDAAQSESPLYNWINSLLDENIIPKIYALETCPTEKAYEREENWIKFFRPLGIFNKSNGAGGKGLKNNWTPLARENFIKRTIERNKRGWTPQMRKKIIKCLTGKKMRPEVKEKMMAADSFKVTTRKLAECNLKKSRPLFCIETGEKFNSINAALPILKCGASTLINSILKKKKFRGQTWSFEKKEIQNVPSCV